LQIYAQYHQKQVHHKLFRHTNESQTVEPVMVLRRTQIVLYKISFENDRSSDRLCGLVVRVPGYRFPGLPDFLKSSGSGTGSTQPREDN
jgi:hypothetical protein